MKKIKGFTLLELIIVMAILSILMISLIQMFKPIRNTYVDSTLIENQRTVQNGIVTYISESVRFATDLGIYNNGVAGADGALEQFIRSYLEANGASAADAANAGMYQQTRLDIYNSAEIIIVDYPKASSAQAYNYANGKYTGRLLRRKLPDTPAASVSSLSEPDGETIVKAPVNKEWRLALGAAYYGTSDYTITFNITQDGSYVGNPNDGIGVTVASLMDGKAKLRDNRALGRTATVVETNGLVMCKNLCSPINGMFDTTKFDDAVPRTPGPQSRTYIVFINKKVPVNP
ncbi:MAG: prepilin-type N-terminal cleavage/methylation domain-containing protein [Oscillospiraceae bacterium]|nr:prepilin-type N-terminal cleavage/methylation domain-containing protein [Oscillospiraceae bacterium]